MDPNTALETILRLAWNEDSELAETITNLNEWITRGGFLPTAWTRFLPTAWTRVMPRVDDNGTAHTWLCWTRAGRCLDENVRTAGVPIMADGTVPEWHTTADSIIGTWLSDGTVTCAC
jgi:hypothetical protein